MGLYLLGMMDLRDPVVDKNKEKEKKTRLTIIS